MDKGVGVQDSDNARLLVLIQTIRRIAYRLVLIRTFRRITHRCGDWSGPFPGHAPESVAILAQESSAILAQRPLGGMTNKDVGVQDSDNARLLVLIRTFRRVAHRLVLIRTFSRITHICGDRSGPVPGHAPESVAILAQESSASLWLSGLGSA
jgi:hypothetical protein